MPRPRGKALDIAEQVVPGLAARMGKKKSHKKKKNVGELSEVEILQTNNIENKEGLDETTQARL